MGEVTTYHGVKVLPVFDSGRYKDAFAIAHEDLNDIRLSGKEFNELSSIIAFSVAHYLETKGWKK